MFAKFLNEVHYGDSHKNAEVYVISSDELRDCPWFRSSKHWMLNRLYLESGLFSSLVAKMLNAKKVGGISSGKLHQYLIACGKAIMEDDDIRLCGLPFAFAIYAGNNNYIFPADNDAPILFNGVAVPYDREHAPHLPIGHRNLGIGAQTQWDWCQDVEIKKGGIVRHTTDNIFLKPLAPEF